MNGTIKLEATIKCWHYWHSGKDECVDVDVDVGEAFSRRAEAPVRTKRAWLTDEDPGQPQHTANVQMCCVGCPNNCPAFHARVC